MDSKLILILSILFITVDGTAFAQKKIVQHLSWEEEEYAGQYGIIIEKEGDGKYTEVFREFTEDYSVELSLGAGRYRYRIQVYDLLDRPQGSPEWEYFDVQIALQPEIQTLKPDFFYLNGDRVWRMTLAGRNLLDGAEVFLRRRGDEQNILPLEMRTDETGQTMGLTFTAGQLSVGEFDLYLKNPGGLDTSRGNLRVASLKRVDFSVSAGYAPLIPLYGNFFDVFDHSFDPRGTSVRFGVIPFKKTWGYMGAEFESFWNSLEGSQDGDAVFSHITGGHIKLLYQRWLSMNLAVNLRLGGGVTTGDSEPLPGYYGSVGSGASFQWFPQKPFFLELGLEYNHIFTRNGDPHQGYLRLMVGSGLQF